MGWRCCLTYGWLSNGTLVLKPYRPIYQWVNHVDTVQSHQTTDTPMAEVGVVSGVSTNARVWSWRCSAVVVWWIDLSPCLWEARDVSQFLLCSLNWVICLEASSVALQGWIWCACVVVFSVGSTIHTCHWSKLLWFSYSFSPRSWANMVLDNFVKGRLHIVQSKLT